MILKEPIVNFLYPESGANNKSEFNVLCVEFECDTMVFKSSELTKRNKPDKFVSC